MPCCIVAEELPCCPIFRCANRLTKNEIAKISERAPHMRQVCARLIEASPDDSPEEPPVIFFFFPHYFKELSRFHYHYRQRNSVLET